MKKIIGLLAILSFTVACKDVEKNPGGCDYGYTSDGAGECLSSDYTFDLKINDANNSLYGRSLILKYAQKNSSYDLNWLIPTLEQDMLNEGVISKLVEVEVERPKLYNYAETLHSDLEGLYNSSSLNIWDDINKAMSYRNLLNNAPIQHSGIFERSINDYTISELSDLTQRKQTLLNKLELLANQRITNITTVNIRRAPEYNNYINVLSLSFRVSSTVIPNTNKSIEESPECEGRVYECKVELQQEVEELFNDLYHSTYKNLF